MIEIFPYLWIPLNELRFTATRSSGPGGQNVNKVNTRITLFFDIDASSLTEEQKERVHNRLANRINQDGVLILSSQSHRTQAANREAAVEKFAVLLRKALTVKPPRMMRKVSKAAKKRRLEAKRRHSDRKQMRKKIDWGS